MAKAKVKPKDKKSVSQFVSHNLTRLPLPQRDHESYTEWPQEPSQAPPGAQQGHDRTGDLRQATQSAPAPRRAVLVEPDPLAGGAGMIYVVAGQRMLAFAQQHPQEVKPESFVRMCLARVAVKDPTVKLLVALDADTGEVLAHSMSVIEGSGTDRWVFCYQIQVDPVHTDIVDQMIAAAAAWAKPQGVNLILMATELDPVFWQRKYEFESVRTVMRRAI